MTSPISPDTSPETLQTLVAGYVLNDLNDTEANLLEELQQTPKQASTVKQLIEQTQNIFDRVYCPDVVQPPTQLRAAVLSSFAAMQAPAPEPQRSNSQSQSVVMLPLWVRAGGAVAAILIAALSLSNYGLWRSLQTLKQQQANQPDAPSQLQTVALQTTADFSQLTGTVTDPQSVQAIVQLDPTDLKGTLRIDHLPPLAPGKVYVLWTVLDPEAPFTTDSKGAILTHVFTVETQGKPSQTQSQTLVLPMAFQTAPYWVKAIAITVEDAAAPQRHQTSPILIQKL